MCLPRLHQIRCLNAAHADAQMQIAIGLLFHDDANVDPPGTIAGLNKRGVIMALSWLDLFGCVGYFAFSLYFIVWTRRIAEKASESTVSIADYSVRVRELPADADPDELQKFFEQWGPVSSDTGMQGRWI